MRRAGFTLVELLLALGLLSILMLALVRLTDTALTIWGTSERERDLSARGAALLDELARDLRALELGPSGNLVCAWELHDRDGDGLAGLPLPRLALVRARSAAETARATAALADAPEEDGLALAPGAPRADRRARERDRAAAPTPAELLRRARAGDRVEVLWACAPPSAAGASPSSAGALPVLVRAESELGAPDAPSLLALASASGAGARPTELGDEMAAGVLWLSFAFATATSVLDEGWRVGPGLADCSASWDAWVRGRPDREVSGFNEPAPGLVAADAAPILPRRVRIELELERPEDVARRPRLAAPLEPGETRLVLDGARALPPAGAHVLVGDEWLELVHVRGGEASVRRARRGTVERAHAAGAVVHHGRRFAREVPLGGTREEWMR